MSKIALEYQGFLRYIARVEKEIPRWFGPYCNNDPIKIVSMTACEWDVMADDERHFFLKSDELGISSTDPDIYKSKYPFLSYLLNKRYLNVLQQTNESPKTLLDLNPFNPKFAKSFANQWKSLPENEREKYSKITLNELCMGHIVEGRDKLHQLYEPKELTLLEYILKTEPKKPYNSRAWFLALKNLPIKGPGDTWNILTPVQKRFYDDCASIDKRRYKYAKNMWITKLLSINLEENEFVPPELEITIAEPTVVALNSIIELNKDLNPVSPRLKRPPSAFSIFIKDFYSRTDEIDTFTGQTMKRLANAWHNLPEEEKTKYKLQSQILTKSWKAERQYSIENQNRQPDISEISAGLFRHSKSINGPSRPQHLYRLRVPHARDMYGRMNKIKLEDRQKAWDSLSDKEKEPFYRECESIQEIASSQKALIKDKLIYLDQLLYKAKQLENLKRQMKLMRTRRRSARFHPTDAG